MASPFNPQYPMTAISYVWEKDPSGNWDPYLVREQAPSAPSIMKLTRVAPGEPVCMACLSMDVQLLYSDRYPEGELLCNNCGVQYGIVL